MITFTLHTNVQFTNYHMDPDFITYQKFNDPALADELAEQLELHQIEYTIEEESTGFDPSLVMSNEAKYYAVKIKSEDFETVNELLKQNEEANTDEVEKDYYLFSFTDDELMEVVTKADEWSAFDVVLARKLLAERGKEISEQKIATIQGERIEELKKPEESQLTWIIIGYVIALGGVILPFFVSAIGVFIGWHLSSYKKTLPDGERVFGYSETDRMHGKRIFYLGIIVFVLSLAILLFYHIWI
ncbi:hypothetical protein [Mucilaginibacter gotjawali]|uniref:Uncharacterized protein n=2 Tax=Mucilaginibacter gotjawali TaxID=1550579 RepID=A0A0X8X4C6_9SPHI|nr:hypothetical protein [Mucilaginibacter gotjawali]MBB3057420.1 ethanolamine utilization protein EutP (predicted NTPase) [Mucilaginibacter gotjawali]BAU55462.1 hypothetical protein MgSA37_03651 [Mucilaginibacter gotjawali]